MQEEGYSPSLRVTLVGILFITPMNDELSMVRDKICNSCRWRNQDGRPTNSW